ncbi:MAG: malectin domain-containing carbohydrate-binding protein [Anaerolineae bacterium]
MSVVKEGRQAHLATRFRLRRFSFPLALCSILAALLLGALLSTAAPASAASSVTRIHVAGGSYIDPSGKVWAADTGFSGGTTSSTTAAIAKTNAAPLYQTARYGNFSYNVSVPNGSYEVTLRFAEIYWTSAGQRIFNVAINGATVLSNFDIAAQVGAKAALDKTFTTNVTNGTVTITFTTVKDNAIVGAIEILPTGAKRIHAGGGSYAEPSGKVWSADTGFSGGASSSTTAAIANTNAAPLYQAERYGNFSYNVAVPNGSYEVTLRFAEIYRTSAGQRIFNVALNGATVLSNFDITAQVGAKAALDKTFTTNVTNGTVTITFTTVKDNAKVSAIEIVPAGGNSPAPTPTPPPPSGSSSAVYWGAFMNGAPWNMSIQDNFEAQVGKKASLMPLSAYWQHSGQYTTFGNDGYFPTSTMEAVRQHGAIPVLVWGSSDANLGMDQPNFRLAVIANGTHDAYIQQFAQKAKAWGKPFFLKFDWEMNGYWNWPWMESKNGNQPGDFVRAWRHVHDVFVQQGATNVTWVWCPNIADGWTTPMSQLYPGDGYVDWTCLHGYNAGSAFNPPGWVSFNQTFNSTFRLNSYTQVVNLAPSKPMMIGEFASTEAGDGGTAKANWITDAFNVQIPSNMTQIRAWLWYNVNESQPWNIDSSTPALNAFRSSIASNFYSSNRYSGTWTSPIPRPTQ